MEDKKQDAASEKCERGVLLLQTATLLLMVAVATLVFGWHVFGVNMSVFAVFVAVMIASGGCALCGVYYTHPPANSKSTET